MNRRTLLVLPARDDDFLQDHVLHRTVTGPAGRISDGHDHLLTLDDFAEDRVSIV